MSAFTLRLRASPRQRLDMSAFTPDQLVGKTVDEIRRIPLWQGNREVPTGELFHVEGGDADNIVIQSGGDPLDGIGAGMTRGQIRVEGNAGAYLGRGMRGGEIRVAGDVGIFAGTAMREGTIRIDGSCGDFLGAATPGEQQGMRGGIIEVKGNAGDRVGDRQRRGTILIAGSTGDYCAARMRAGTIVVLGSTGIQTALAMRRGSVLLTFEPDLPATFNDNGTHHLGFLSIFAQSLQTFDGPFARLWEQGVRVHRWLGDLGYGGKGEILIWR